MITRRRTLLGMSGLGLVPLSGAAFAQQGRNVRLVVPAAAGGNIDVIGRLFADRMKDTLGQSWIVENRPGASNTLGAAEVARAAPDGATLLTNADIHLMARHVMRRVSYDPVADFSPISRLATSPLVLVGFPGLTFMLWYALWGPKGMPPEMVAEVNAAVQAASKHPELIQRLAALGAEPVIETAQAFAGFLAAEAVRSAEIAKVAGIVPTAN
jgi:tripartite-type tricarboxylate transporter receptor subunit TctC